jgi:hypothetical protein
MNKRKVEITQSDSDSSDSSDWKNIRGTVNVKIHTGRIVPITYKIDGSLMSVDTTSTGHTKINLSPNFKIDVTIPELPLKYQLEACELFHSQFKQNIKNNSIF